MDRRHCRFRDARSGQVLVEAVIALALLLFVWALVAFTTFMTTNHVRTAMAARHAAWQKGNGIAPSARDIEEKFFYEEGLVKVDVGAGHGIGDLISGANASELQRYSGGDRGPYVAKVTFGLTREELGSASVFPFTLMTTEFPLMPPSLMEGFLQVESRCQWDEVGETWTDWQEALQGVMGTFKAEAQGFLRGLVSL